MSLPSRSTELTTLLVGRLPLDGFAVTVLLPSDSAVSARLAGRYVAARATVRRRGSAKRRGDCAERGCISQVSLCNRHGHGEQPSAGAGTLPDGRCGRFRHSD